MLSTWRPAAMTLVAVTALAIPFQALAAPGGEKDNCEAPEDPFVCVGAGTPERPPGERPGGMGGTGGSGGGSNSSRVCTYEKMVPEPPADSSVWEGHKPGDGAVYIERCFEKSDPAGTTVVRIFWSKQQPAAAPAVDSAVLAQQAVDKMLLRGPDIGITPKPGGRGVVGMPVYMWTTTGPETYGPNTASATAGPVSVTATARVSKIVWQMGDGKTVTCTTAGTPYKAEYGKKPSPDCGHRYNVPSSTTSSGKFHVTATSTWTVDWQVTGGGQTGELTEIRDSAVDITVAEVQVLN
ncbi:ATP/GTP-binding protein [Streptomyces sp. NPDC002889]|uniref:ATP/GTP-binding protein n=1 Tax=Streptomyces sp. NPDC002889 TaxID=3364669 RepID=UPI0036A2F846